MRCVQCFMGSEVGWQLAILEWRHSTRSLIAASRRLDSNSEITTAEHTSVCKLNWHATEPVTAVKFSVDTPGHLKYIREMLKLYRFSLLEKLRKMNQNQPAKIMGPVHDTIAETLCTCMLTEFLTVHLLVNWSVYVTHVWSVSIGLFH